MKVRRIVKTGSLLFLLGAIVLASAPGSALAQFEPLKLYGSGELSFAYDQWPFGGYSGEFAAAGEGVDWENGLDPDWTEAVGGAMVAVGSDSVATFWYGLVHNDDETVDMSLLFVMSEGLPTPGYYAIDPEALTAECVFFDDIDNFTLPEDIDPESLLAWLEALSADYRFYGISGNIILNTVDSETLTGSFTGRLAEPDQLMLIDVSDGIFDLEGGGVSAIAETPTPMAEVWAYPNPFNPRTTIALALDRPQWITISIHDLAGRQLRLLHEGVLDAGTQTRSWNGCDQRGDRQAGGVYLYRVMGEGWQQGGKVVLLP